MLNYVLPEALHQGIGKRMLQALEAHAIASGIERIEVVSTIPAKEEKGISPICNYSLGCLINRFESGP